MFASFCGSVSVSFSYQDNKPGVWLWSMVDCDTDMCVSTCLNTVRADFKVICHIMSFLNQKSEE